LPPPLGLSLYHSPLSLGSVSAAWRDWGSCRSEATRGWWGGSYYSGPPAPDEAEASREGSKGQRRRDVLTCPGGQAGSQWHTVSWPPGPGRPSTTSSPAAAGKTYKQACSAVSAPVKRTGGGAPALRLSACLPDDELGSEIWTELLKMRSDRCRKNPLRVRSAAGSLSIGDRPLVVGRRKGKGSPAIWRVSVSVMMIGWSLADGCPATHDM
jgi:hypothetical protein